MTDAKYLGLTANQLAKIASDLKAENAKLRELCKDLYMCTDDTCNDCKYRNLTGDGFYCKLGIGWRARRMREMGIEVEYDKD